LLPTRIKLVANIAYRFGHRAAMDFACLDFMGAIFGDAPAERFTRRCAAEAGAATALSCARGAHES
jgi:hypothetical protein